MPSLVQLALTTRFRAHDPSLNFTNNQYEVRVCPKKNLMKKKLKLFFSDSHQILIAGMSLIRFRYINTN